MPSVRTRASHKPLLSGRVHNTGYTYFCRNTSVMPFKTFDLSIYPRRKGIVLGLKLANMERCLVVLTCMSNQHTDFLS